MNLHPYNSLLIIVILKKPRDRSENAFGYLQSVLEPRRSSTRHGRRLRLFCGSRRDLSAFRATDTLQLSRAVPLLRTVFMVHCFVADKSVT